MNYEVISANWISPPKAKESDPTKVQVYVNVTTGIVGDVYGFTKVDTMLAECAASMTFTQMNTSIGTQAITFSATKYPNT